MTAVCDAQFRATRDVLPFPFTRESLAATLAQPPQEPSTFRTIREVLNLKGSLGLSSLAIVEGCAFLFQKLSTNPGGWLHGQHILAIARTRHTELYGTLYQENTHRIGKRALRETLFVGTVALAFEHPEEAISVILDLNAELLPIHSSENFGKRRDTVLGSPRLRTLTGIPNAYEIVRSGQQLDHPISRSPLLFAGTSDAGGTTLRALCGGMKGAATAALRELPFVLRGVIHCPSEAVGGGSDRTKEVEMRSWLARLALAIGEQRLEDEDVQSRIPRA
jgi:hypothetical protein